MALRAAGVGAAALGPRARARRDRRRDRRIRRPPSLVAERRGELLGLCTAYLELNSVRFGPRCWVEDLAVSPEHRSQGVGKALLDPAKDWARERGATHLELDSAETRRDAHRFYEREAPSWRSVSYAWEL